MIPNIFAPNGDDESYDPVTSVIRLGYELPDGAAFDPKECYRTLVVAAQTAYDEPNEADPNEASPLGLAITYGVNVRLAINRELAEPTAPSMYAYSDRDESGWKRDGASEQDDGVITFYEAPLAGTRWLLVAMRHRVVACVDNDGRWQVDLEEHWIEQDREDAAVKTTHRITVALCVDRIAYKNESEAHAAVRLHAAVDARYMLPEPNDAFESFFD